MKRERKKQGRRWISFLLALSMVVPMLSFPDFADAASAAPELLEIADDVKRANSFETDKHKASADGTNKPTLFIDFLGDNTTGTPTGSGAYGEGGSVPTQTDRSVAQSGAKTPAGTWDRYTGTFPNAGTNGTGYGDTVFWVGVGINKMKLFELAKKEGETGKGLSAVELGFYYNPAFVEPYTGGGDYKTVLANANLTAGAPSNSLNRWNKDLYHIEDATIGLNPVVDSDTQEPMVVLDPDTGVKIGDFDPATATGWKMLHVSLERTLNDAGTAWAAGENRFADTDSAPLNDDSIYYIMMLPFTLKAYDDDRRLCFRLARNASSFSMGGGAYGAGSYDDSNVTSSFGAWEANTRTPSHNLKEMFDFEGDLNIFTGKNESDQFYKATLQIVNWGFNTAVLYPTDDPDKYVNTGDGKSDAYPDRIAPYGVISKLRSGTPMTLDVTKVSSDVLVSVSTTDSSGNALSTLAEVAEDSKYTFVMPKSDVTVTVIFKSPDVGASDYKVLLDVVDEDGDAPKALNSTTISGRSSDLAAEAPDHAATATGATVGEPEIKVAPDNTVTIQSKCHPDYYAVVTAETLVGNSVVVTPLPGAVDEVPDGDMDSYPRTYTHTFPMPSADTRVTVAYHKYHDHTATLQVNTDDAHGSINNIARLSYVDYRDVDTDDLSGAVTKSVQVNGKVGGNAILNSTSPSIPQTRRVTLDIALEADYTVTEITRYDRNESGVVIATTNLLPFLVPKDPVDGAFTRTLSFDMPDNAVEVFVRFDPVGNYDAKLVLKYPSMGTGTLSGKHTGTDDTGTYNETNMLPEDPEDYKDTIKIQSGNTGKVKIYPDEGYRVKEVKITTTNILLPVLTYTGDPNEDGEIQFVMPAAKVTVTVTFEEIEREKYKITLQPVPDDTSAYDLGTAEDPKSGWVMDPDAPALEWPSLDGLNAVEAATTLTAWIQVKPGWHIAKVEVIGDDSGTMYPLLSMDGNGYNGGLGGRVTMKVNQPPENTTVYVYLKEGLPDPEPPQGVTLLVSDPENTDGTDNNWAKISVNDSSPAQPDPDGVKKGGSYTDSSVIAGDLVTITWNADTGYYVSDVVVAPESSGVVPTWLMGEDGPYVQFTQPAGHTTATVKFAKIDPENPPIKATLHVFGAITGESGTLTNTGTTASVTVAGPDGDPASVGAWPGQVFETAATTDRYVLVEVYKGGSLVSWTATSGEGNGSFVMPAGNVDVFMTFRTDPIPDNARRITLTSYGPGVAGDPGGSGKATLYINGSEASASAGPDGPVAKSNQSPVPTVRAFATIGDTIKVVAIPEDGFVVDHIAYTPSGSVTPVELLAPPSPPNPEGGRTVEFTMPSTAVSVQVFFRRGEVTRHMANIVIRPPAGVSASDVGDGRFTANNGYSIAAAAGTGLKVKAWANPGYYISKVEITPAALGIPGLITGSFATQYIDFVMPDADCLVNIYYEKGWPDSYQANLIVHDADQKEGNRAILKDITKGTELGDYVMAGSTGVGRDRLKPVAPMDVMTVKILSDSDYKVELPISITDPAGTQIPYWWSGEGEISFYMPGNWVNVDVTYTKKEAGEDPYGGLIARLHYTGSPVSASITHGIDSATTDGGAITGLHTGDVITIKTQPPTGKVPVILVRRSDKSMIAIPMAEQVGDDYVTSFAMPERIGETEPDEDAGVYITYVDAPGEDPREYLGTLIVTQEGGSTYNSQAVMHEKVDTSVTTGTVTSGNAGAVGLKPGKTVVIETAPDTGFLVKTVVVTDKDGNRINVVQTGPNTYEYTMPEETEEVTGSPVTAVVTFREKKTAEEGEPDPEKYTAQVVVNNDGDEDNTVVLRKTSEGTPAAMLTDLSPADPVYVDITVAPGSKVKLVMVSPSLGGVFTLTLTDLDTKSQKLSFLMPADDVIVYVEFENDGVKRYNVTMEVFDETTPETDIVINGTDNVATLHSDVSGTTDPASKHGDDLVSVKGAPGEVITITAKPRSGYYPIVTAKYAGTETSVYDLTVGDLAEDGTIRFTFSVPSSDVETEVHFYPDTVERPKHKVRLHITLPGGATYTDVVDADNTFVKRTVSPFDQINTDGFALSDVAYMQHVSVKGTAKVKGDNTGYYLQAAYAISGGVTLAELASPAPVTDMTTVPPYTYERMKSHSFDFMMQNGDVDVYLIFADDTTLPAGEHNIGLVVRGPAGVEEPVVGAAGSARMKNHTNGEETAPNTDYPTALSAASDQTYDPVKHSVSANPEDTFTVRIKVNPGYQIDTVVVTPFYPIPSISAILPTSISFDDDAGEWVYTYKYPTGVACNLTVNVNLKTKEIDAYKVTLYLDEDHRETKAVEPADYINKADVSYTTVHLTEDVSVDGKHLNVPETEFVQINVTAGVDTDEDPDVQYYVHHAYAVTKGNEERKSGRVLPLRKLNDDGETLDTSGIIKLQNIGLESKPKTGKAYFEMPDEDVDVHIAFYDQEADAPKKPVGQYAAVLTVHEPVSDYADYLGTSAVRMEEMARHANVTQPSTGVTSIPISVNEGEKIVLNWYGLIVPSYRVKRITVTGGESDQVFEPAPGVTEFSYTMNDYDVGFIVELEAIDPVEYKATLHLENHSSALDNTVKMWEAGYPTPVVTTHLGTLTGLGGTAEVLTKPTVADSSVVVRAVIATDATGTHILTKDPDTGEYSYTLNYHDVDITVIFDNATTDQPMYVAMVEKTGVTYYANNTAQIKNTSVPALPKGNIWTGIYATNSLQVDVTTEVGYYAIITARRASEPAGTASIPVLQLGVTGTVVGYLDVPADLSENVIVTVNYTADRPPEAGPHDLTLVHIDPAVNVGNKAKTAYVDSNEDVQALEVEGNATADTTDKTNDKKPMGGDPIDLTTETAVGYIQRITLTSGGLTVDLPVADGSFFMPLGDATVTVTRRNTTRTARPHDWNQHPTDVGGYVDGYLKARNLGGNKAPIQVPNLYEKVGSEDVTTQANNSDVTYKLYIRTGGTYTALVEGVDYDIISSGSYTYPGTDTANISKLPGDDKGWQYTIRSLKGESALTDIIRNGGVLYITATEGSNDESQKVEVVLPADPNAGTYWAKLVIVDTSSKTGNSAKMSDGVTTVVNSGTITGLNGDELIRTLVTDTATGAQCIAVTVTDSAGTILLTENPAGTERYPYYMTGENITVTVYFASVEDPSLTRYIASVTKRGAYDVAGNGATIKNATRSDLARGNIWAQGHPDNTMRVDVTLAKDYYATIKAKRISDGVEVPVVAFGAGPGTGTGTDEDPWTTFHAIFTMPADDVQVIVTYTKDPPDNLKSELILKLVDHDSHVENTATLTEKVDSPTVTLTADGEAPKKSSLELDADPDKIKVAAGTQFKLTTGSKPATETDPAYYVKKVLLKIYAEGADVDTATPLATMTLPLASDKTVDPVTMPLGRTVVEVVYSDAPRTGRPYDLEHSADYNDYNDPDYVAGSSEDYSDPTQSGWILAREKEPLVEGDNTYQRISVTIPALHDDESVADDKWTALSDAGVADTGPAADYKFYWKDGMGEYHLFTTTGSNPDLTVTFVEAVSVTYNVTDSASTHSFVNYQFTLTANQIGGLAEYYIKKGGTIYVTATNTPSVESDYTQIVIPKLYTATLWYTPAGAPTVSPGGTAKMSVPDKDPVTDHGAVISGLQGSEVVTISEIVPTLDPEYVLVGVVASTETGSVTLTGSDGVYTYTMNDESVDIRVIFDRRDNPLSPKGPHIVTVFKEGHDDLAANNAWVQDLDVDVADDQQGDIWTVAYSGNVVRVDFTTETGYVVDTITAVKTNGATGSVPVLRYGTYAIFYMPDGCDVNVTVKYKTGEEAKHALRLKLIDHDNAPGNQAQVTFTGDSLTADGTAPTGGPEDVAVNDALHLTTGTASTHSVKKAQLVVDGFPDPIDILLTDGASLPDPLMPYAEAEVQVTYQTGARSPRPYEPTHAEVYNPWNDPDYVPADDDISRTHQDGWIKAATKGTNKFDIPIRTLHDMKGDGGTDQLYHAWYMGGMPNYRLYWKDEAGVFHLLTQGEGGDITVTRTRINQDVEEDDPYVKGDDKYDGYVLSVTVNVDDDGNAKNLWGGYKLLQYLKNGGSIFVTSTRSGELESEKTEVVLTARTYTATLRWKPIGVDPEGSDPAAKMSIPGHDPVTDHNAKITDLDGTEVVTVSDLYQPFTVGEGDDAVTYRVLGVVAITDSGTVNADKGEDGKYTYTMANEDVIMQVVYKRDDDPLKEKGPQIVTVYKVDHDDEPENSARVKDMDVAIPSYQRGDIWTAAYEGNVVRVDVGVKAGYYALITAVQKDGSDSPVPVAQFATFNGDGDFVGCYGLLYMPADYDVDVTVQYIKLDDLDTLPSYDLTLKVVEEPALPDESLVSNAATIVDKLPPDSPALTMNASTGTDAGPTSVKVGTFLNLSTTPYSGWSVKKVTMDLLDDLGNVLTTLEVPVIDGKSVPVPTMPFSKAVITVTFWEKAQLGRPYDPAHSEEYNKYDATDNPTGYKLDPDDISESGMEGWILATGATEDSFTITVPTLFNYRLGTYGSESDGRVTDAAASADSADIVNHYKLYWKDEMGNFQPITVGDGNDVTLTHVGVTTGSPWPGKDSYTFTVTVNKSGDPEMPTLWGGYKLLEYLADGGSVYIAHVYGENESEKTEVVILVDNSGLRPYDPERFYTDGTSEADRKYDTPGANWIRAENRGDYAIVTVPTLYDNGKSAMEDVQWTVLDEGETETTAAWTRDKFKFYLKVESEGETTYVNLVEKGIIELSHPDPDHDPAEDPRPYEMGNYYTDDQGTEDTEDDVAYIGARFLLTPTKTREEFEDLADTDENKALGLAIWDILDNYGTKSGETDHDYSLYITVERTSFDPDDDGDPVVQEGPYVDFEVPQYYQLLGVVESYAPKHITTFSLYPADVREQEYGEPPEDYAAFVEACKTHAYGYTSEPSMVFTTKETWGSGLWSVPFALKSSELMGKDGTGVTYRFTIEKAGHVTFTWWALELKPEYLDDNVGNDGHTFTIASYDGTTVVTGEGGVPVPNTIALFGGDVDGDNFVRMDDYVLLSGYFGGGLKWTKSKVKTSAKWATSTYNKGSFAYVSDLNGDGEVTIDDAAIWNIDRNRAKGPGDYEEQHLFGEDYVPTALEPVMDLTDLTVEQLREMLENPELAEDIRAAVEARIAELEAKEAEIAAAEEAAFLALTAEELHAKLGDETLELSDEEREKIEARIAELEAEEAEIAAAEEAAFLALTAEELHARLEDETLELTDEEREKIEARIAELESADLNAPAAVEENLIPEPEEVPETSEEEATQEAETESAEEPEGEAAQDTETEPTEEPEGEAAQDTETEPDEEPEEEAAQEAETEPAEEPGEEVSKEAETESAETPEQEATNEEKPVTESEHTEEVDETVMETVENVEEPAETAVEVENVGMAEHDLTFM